MSFTFVCLLSHLRRRKLQSVILCAEWSRFCDVAVDCSTSLLRVTFLMVGRLSSAFLAKHRRLNAHPT